MCGTLAVLQFDNRPIDPASVIRMRDTVVHRCPDGEGLYFGVEAKILAITEHGAVRLN